MLFLGEVSCNLIFSIIKTSFPLACRSMVIYHICCRKCGPSQAYIGKTVNTLFERFHASGSGHLHPNNVDSALLNYINKSGDPDCAFHFEDVKVLETGRYDQKIRFIESILLKYDRQKPQHLWTQYTTWNCIILVCVQPHFKPLSIFIVLLCNDKNKYWYLLEYSFTCVVSFVSVFWFFYCVLLALNTTNP